MNRKQSEKVALLFIFGVGAFAAVCSMVRLHSIYNFTLSDDPIRDSILVNLWSIIELCVAISCASVPGLKSFFSRSTRPTWLGGKGKQIDSQPSSSQGWKSEDSPKKDSGTGEKQRSWFSSNRESHGTETTDLEITMHDNEAQDRESAEMPPQAPQAKEHEFSGQLPPAVLFLAPPHMEVEPSRPTTAVEGIEDLETGMETDDLEDVLPFSPVGLRPAVSSRKSSLATDKVMGN
jgi:hypothetical protein